MSLELRDTRHVEAARRTRSTPPHSVPARRPSSPHSVSALAHDSPPHRHHRCSIDRASRLRLAPRQRCRVASAGAGAVRLVRRLDARPRHRVGLSRGEVAGRGPRDGQSGGAGQARFDARGRRPHDRARARPLRDRQQPSRSRGVARVPADVRGGVLSRSARGAACLAEERRSAGDGETVYVVRAPRRRARS